MQQPVPDMVRLWITKIINGINNAYMIHLSHNDLDGDGNLMLTSAIANRKIRNRIAYGNISELSKSMEVIKNYIETCTHDHYMFLITDIGSLNINELNDLAQQYSNNGRAIKFIVLDHHRINPSIFENIPLEQFRVKDVGLNWIYDFYAESEVMVFTTEHVQYLYCNGMCATMQYFMWICAYAAGSERSAIRLFRFMEDQQFNFVKLYNFVVGVDLHDRGLSLPVRYDIESDFDDETICPYAEKLDILHSALKEYNKNLPDPVKMDLSFFLSYLVDAMIDHPFNDKHRQMIIESLEKSKELYEKFYDGLVEDVHLKGDKSLIISDKIPTETGTDDFIMAIQVPEELVNEQFFFAYIVDAAHGLTKYPYSDFSKNIFLVKGKEIDLIFRVNTHYNSVDIRARNTFPYAFAVGSFNGGGGHPCAAGFPIKE